MTTRYEAPYYSHDEFFTFNQNLLQTANSSREAAVTLKLVSPKEEVEGELFANPNATCLYNSGQGCWIYQFVAPTPIPLPPGGHNNLRLFRLELLMKNLALPIVFDGLCRVSPGEVIMTHIRDDLQQLTVFTNSTALVSISYVFNDQVLHLATATNVIAPAVPNVSPPPTVKSLLAAQTLPGKRTQGELEEASPPPLQLYLQHPDLLARQLETDVWSMVAANGSVLADQILNDPSAPPSLASHAVTSVIQQAVLVQMARSHKTRPSAKAILTMAGQHGLLTPLLSSLDFPGIVSSSTDEDVFSFFIDFLGEDDSAMGIIASSVAPYVVQRMREATFLGNILKLLSTPAIRRQPVISRSVLVELFQSPVYFKQTACNALGADVIIQAIVGPSRSELVIDAIRTFGFGQKKMMIAVGTNEHGARVLSTIIRVSPQDADAAMFDFRDALGDCVKRLAVNPNGSSVIDACLDHPFLRERTMHALVFDKPEDAIHRALPLIVKCLSSETDSVKRLKHLEFLMKHAVLLDDAQRALLSGISKSA